MRSTSHTHIFILCFDSCSILCCWNGFIILQSYQSHWKFELSLLVLTSFPRIVLNNLDCLIHWSWFFSRYLILTEKNMYFHMLPFVFKRTKSTIKISYYITQIISYICIILYIPHLPVLLVLGTYLLLVLLPYSTVPHISSQINM